ncbi:MAG: hypothetical protein JOY64_15955 [Alphaproteobacteria bacterium]|nr:hypothetical protein [Alphaproteobacteria bacterium]
MSLVAEAERTVAGVASGLRWLPWAIAGVAIVAGAGGTLWYRGQYLACQASVALDAAKAEEKLNAQKAADAAFTRTLELKLAPITKAIEEQANATQLALAKVPSNPNCARTPAAAAFDGSVRPDGQQAGAGPARPAGPRAH